jgi:hypothetical protein
MVRSTVKENWRDNVTVRSTEIVTCDTNLPIDIGQQRTPLLFNVRPVPNQLIDTKNIRLLVKFRLLKLQPATKETPEKWVGVTTGDGICIHNNFGFALFEDIHLTINGVLAETAQREYARASYLKNLLFANCTEKRMLEGAFFYEDTPGAIDLANFIDSDSDTGSGNRGVYERMLAIQRGQEANFIAPVYLDILQAGVYFPDYVGFTLHFYPAKPVNCVLYDGEAATPPQIKLEILDAELHVPRCQLSTPALKQFPVQYESLKVLSYINPKEVQSFSRSLNINQLPKKLAIVVLGENQYHGINKPSAINFKNHNVKTVRVRCNGQTYPTAVGMSMDFEKEDHRQPYMALFSQLNAVNPHFGIGSIDDGYAIFGVDLPPGHKRAKIENGGVYGTCDVDIDFGNKPAENLVILIFCFYDSQFSFNGKGIVHNSAEVKL